MRLRRQRQANLSKIKANLVYIARARPVKAIKFDTVSKTDKTRKSRTYQ